MNRATRQSGSTTTLVIGLAIAAVGAVLLAEGLGWWQLDRSDLRYLVPTLLIVLGAVSMARGLTNARASAARH